MLFASYALRAAFMSSRSAVHNSAIRNNLQRMLTISTNANRRKRREVHQFIIFIALLLYEKTRSKQEKGILYSK
jgi:hypothetical protein